MILLTEGEKLGLNLKRFDKKMIVNAGLCSNLGDGKRQVAYQDG